MNRIRRRARLVRPCIAACLVAFGLLAACGGDPLAEARKRQEAEDFEGSLPLLQNLASERPNDAEVQYRYGLALVRTGQPSLAIWSLRRAMDDPQWLDPAARVLAQSTISTGNPDAGIDAMNQLLEKKPDDADALVLRARAKIESRRDYEGALADAEAAIAIDPDHSDALVMRAVALLMLARADDAEQALKDLEARAVDVDLGLDVGARFCVARAMFEQAKERFDSAEAMYEKCLADFPADGTVVNQSISFFDEQEKPERSLAILQKLVDADPLASSARLELSKRLESAGRRDEAEKVLRDGTTVRDAELASVAWIDLANLLASRGDLPGSADALGHAVEKTRDPRPELVYQYADTLVMTGQIARAREVAKQLTVPAHRELFEARALMQEGHLKEALAHFDEGLRLWPDNAVARYYAARTAERVGDLARAIDDYRYSIRAGVTQTDARYRLARLHEAARTYDLAVGVGRHSTPEVPPDPEAELVALRVLSRLGRLNDVQPFVVGYSQDPERWGRAVAAMAQGVRASRGAAEAARFVRGAHDLDLDDPRNADALAELVSALCDSGDAPGAVKAAEAAVAKHGDVARFHALRGQALAAARKNDAARAAYERALALDPKNAPALLGLGRLEVAEGHLDAALARYADAVAAQGEVDLGDPTPWREDAELLLAQGRKDEAIARLEDLLLHDPYDGGAAARLAVLRADSEQTRDEALSLAKRAVFFGGSPEAWEALAQVQTARGDSEQAALAKSRAERARAGHEIPPEAEPPSSG